MAVVFLIAFFALLALALLPAREAALAFLAAIYRSGALVFGGGHVVLPLLRAAVVDPGLVNDSAFLAGYGAAQAMPGPLFTFGAYLGAVAPAPGGVLGAALALIAIFLPGMLISSARCRSGTRFGPALAPAPRWRASMQRSRPARLRSLRSGLDGRGPEPGRFRRRRDGLRSARRLARAPARRGRAHRGGGRRPRCCGGLGAPGIFRGRCQTNFPGRMHWR